MAEEKKTRKSRGAGEAPSESEPAAPAQPEAPAAAAPTGPADAATGEAPPLVIAAQYIKDLSFESPGAPGVFTQMAQNPPQINIKIDVKAKGVQDNTYEVSIEVNADAKTGEATAFILELVYGGLFTLNVPAEHLQPVLLIECPRLLFPFVRNIIADATRDGGFPPLLLAPVDFAGLYQNRLQQMAAQADPPAAAT